MKGVVLRAIEDRGRESTPFLLVAKFLPEEFRRRHP